MPVNRKRILLIIVGIVIITISIGIFIRSYFLGQLETTLQEKLLGLNQSGYTVSYDSIQIDWDKSVLLIGNFRIQKNEYDTTCIQPEFISAKVLRAEGFQLQDVILDHKLNFTSLTLIRPHIVIRKSSKLLVIDSASFNGSEFIINAKETRLLSARIQYIDNVSCKPISEVASHINIADLTISRQNGKPLAVKARLIGLDKTQAVLPEKLYTISVKRTSINFPNRTVAIDTVKIQPHYNKLLFGRRKGYEVDRIEGSIPFIRLSGFNMDFRDSLVLAATKGELKMFLKIFRDKRLPFKSTFKPLPAQLLKALPVSIHLDTLEFKKSYVEYGEFSEDADTPGKIFFDNLEAVIHHIDNNGQRKQKTTMVARADLMGQGDLEVRSEFPWGNAGKCLITGSLKKIAIPKVNMMMEGVTNMKAESGMLENLTFRFTYDAIRSNGELELNYNNLKLVSYKDEEKTGKRGRSRKKREPDKKDNFKTFILNTFVIRKNLDEKVPEEKRTGEILFYRDTSRSLFNYWWKSLLTGLRAAFKLDKYNERDNKKNRRKSKQK